MFSVFLNWKKTIKVPKIKRVEHYKIHGFSKILENVIFEISYFTASIHYIKLPFPWSLKLFDFPFLYFAVPQDTYLLFYKTRATLDIFFYSVKIFSWSVSVYDLPSTCTCGTQCWNINASVLRFININRRLSRRCVFTAALFAGG